MEWKLYANVKDASSMHKTETGWERDQTIHISSAKTLGWENIEINSMEDFEKLLSENPKVNHVMYYFGWCPRRGTDPEKAIKWVKKLLKTKDEINNSRR
ncbi:MAG: hypothetical protein KG003_13835 [Bacteroidetes bacterium]|nr:hypothetical protein [Bacteroidota bacterium]